MFLAVHGKEDEVETDVEVDDEEETTSHPGETITTTTDTVVGKIIRDRNVHDLKLLLGRKRRRRS